MKRLTKSIKNRIYSILVDIPTNTITIHRGRGGLEDSKAIFDERGMFEYQDKTQNVQLQLIDGRVRDMLYMVYITIDEAETIIANIVWGYVQQLEKKMQKGG